MSLSESVFSHRKPNPVYLEDRNKSLISLVFTPVSHFLANCSCRSSNTHCTTTLGPLSSTSACVLQNARV